MEEPKKRQRRSKVMHCTFCQKPHLEVRKLIAGPLGAFICDECIDLCNSIIEEEGWASATTREHRLRHIATHTALVSHKLDLLAKWSRELDTQAEAESLLPGLAP